MTKWHMRIASWIPKATNTLSVYAMIIDFPLQQWLHERASMLRYTYIACLVFFILGLFNDALKSLRYLIFLTPERSDLLWGPRSAGFLSRGYSGRGVKLTTRLHLVSMSRMSGVTPLPTYMLSWPTPVKLHLWSRLCFRCTESPSVHFGRN
jgi:hypothetical protein